MPPKSASKKETKARLERVYAPEVRKDLDNLVKLHADALQTGMLKGKIWTDDHIIARLVAEKRYAESEGVTIIISDLHK